MRLTIRAHFDGKFIVPDEPVELPMGQTFLAELVMADRPTASPTPGQRQAAYERLTSRAIPELAIPDEALRRENLYED